MKQLRITTTVLFLFAGIFILGTSCSNSGKNAQSGASDSLSTVAKESFNEQVNNFDSAWNERMVLLNKRIDQWDSTAQTYRGNLGARMQEKMDQLKQKRDSLESTLDQAGNQAEDSWNSFKQSVRAQYDSIVTGMQNLQK